MTTTQDSSAIVKYVAELISRLFSKTPAFFKVIQVVSVLVTIVTGLPTILESVGITLPAPFSSLESKVVAIAGLVSLFISSLPVSTPVATSGQAVASSAALPYTATAEAKAS